MRGWQTLKLLCVVTVAALSAGCIGLRTEITRERQLLEIDRGYAQMSLDQGAAIAMRAMMAPENSMLSRPEGEYIGGEQAAKAFPPATLGSTDKLYWEPEKAWVSADDNLAVTTGRFVRQVNGGQREQGRYVSVWKRDINDAWRSDLTLMNNDAPAFAAVPLPAAPFITPTPIPAPRPR